MRGWSAIFWLSMLSSVGHAQGVDLSFLQTRAEASNYRETTRYNELMGFLDVLDRSFDKIHLTNFGYTTEGRSLPLVVVGDVADASPEAVRATGKTRVFIQADIHAGEVCGKEAMLVMLRALAAGQHGTWLDSLVLLVAPIYNADGNERINLYNRPRQNGPVGGMGQRPNADGYDLNRDHIKLDTPEARSLVGFFNAYDPHVVIDLHTTNGSRHAYYLTYSPPLNPNTFVPIENLLRGDWLPSITKVIREKYGWEYYYYGNLPYPGMKADRGWYTFDHRPRFNNNYVGLRNRFAVLSEAYAYATFEDRIHATLYFVEALVDYAHNHASEIRAVTAAADSAVVIGTRLAVRARHHKSDHPVEILLGEASETKNPYTGDVILQREDVRHPEQMFEYGTFEPTETEVAPSRYFVPPSLAGVTDRLDAHGVHHSVLVSADTLEIEQFRIDSTRTEEKAFQKHHQRTVYGAYEPARVVLPAGTWVVPVAQPLGRLLFTLLEPRSDDGFVDWNVFDDALKVATVYPIFRQR